MITLQKLYIYNAEEKYSPNIPCYRLYTQSHFSKAFSNISKLVETAMYDADLCRHEIDFPIYFPNDAIKIHENNRQNLRVYNTLDEFIDDNIQEIL